MEEKKVARFVRKMKGLSDAALFRCAPLMACEKYGGKGNDYIPSETEYVIVSSAVGCLDKLPQTYIFPCDATGKITDWGQLRGSFSGGFNHEKALNNAGYDIVAQ